MLFAIKMREFFRAGQAAYVRDNPGLEFLQQSRKIFPGSVRVADGINANVILAMVIHPEIRSILRVFSSATSNLSWVLPDLVYDVHVVQRRCSTVYYSCSPKVM